MCGNLQTSRSSVAQEREECRDRDRVVDLEKVHAPSRQRVDGTFCRHSVRDRDPVCRPGLGTVEERTSDIESRPASSACRDVIAPPEQRVQVASAVAHGRDAMCKERVERAR
jgi:hypothetical protein